MKLWKCILPIATALGLSASFVQADEHDGMSRFQQDLDERDFEAVKGFVEAKKASALQAKIPNLDICGEVKSEWEYISEKIRGYKVRGRGGVYVFREDEVEDDEIYLIGEALPLSHNNFDVQFDLKIKYTTESTWAVSHVRFDNSMGVDDNGLDCDIDPQGYHGSGSCDNLNLKQAYMGYSVYQCEDARFFVELGRRGSLDKIFDSEIQFGSRLDGIVFAYNDKLGCYADWYARAAGFVVDERVNQLAWATEVGFLNICDSGFDFKYSFIDWVKYGTNRCFVHNPIGFKFRNSQWTAAYHFNCCWINQPIELVGAFLLNHTPAKYVYVNGVKKHIGNQNKGWYAGIHIGDLSDGEMNREGDWSVNFIYAVVEAQSMPDDDVNIIGTGNALHRSITCDGIGNVNWQGWQLNAIYGLTNNITTLVEFECSQAYDKKIAGSHEYSKFKLEAIYAF